MCRVDQTPYLPHLTRETPQGRTEVGALTSFSLGRSEERGTVRQTAARCYARTFPDHAERELGAKAPTGVAGFEPATAKLTVSSSTTELHAIVGRRDFYVRTESPFTFPSWISTWQRCCTSCVLSFSYQGASGEVSPNHAINIARWGPQVNRENRT